jgi:hypothetical protein
LPLLSVPLVLGEDINVLINKCNDCKVHFRAKKATRAEPGKCADPRHHQKSF